MSRYIIIGAGAVGAVVAAELTLSREALERLAGSCAEFLIHAVDVEGLCRGIDPELVSTLGEWSPIPTT